MRKLYSGIKKRTAKKFINYKWKKFQYYANGQIDENSIISTCRGYNEKIIDFTPVVRNYTYSKRTLKGWYLSDVDIKTENGFCSLVHCCTFPAETKEEVLSYFTERSKGHSNWDFGPQDNFLLDAIRKGEDPFDEDGCVKEEYKIKRDIAIDEKD